MIISSMCTCFGCADLAFSIYIIHFNLAGCCILLDAKENIPNAFIEQLGRNQNQEAWTYCS